jgi:hypothetical protein
MNLETLQIIIDNTEWTLLGKGSYNVTSVSTQSLTIDGHTGRWVLKTPLTRDHYLSNSARAVRKWNTLNPAYPAFQTKTGWIMPYFGNTPASDQQIASKLIEIYRKTRNIIGDATSWNNFLVSDDEVVCIDMDQAFRRGSCSSEQFDAVHNTFYTEFLASSAKEGFPASVSVIKTLFYLEANLPESDIKDIYLTPYCIEKLHLFRRAKTKIMIDSLDTLLEISDLNATGKIKEEYITFELIEIARVIRQHHKIITHELLMSLIQNQVLGLGIKKIMAFGDVDDIEIVMTHHPALIHQPDDKMSEEATLSKEQQIS